jgi:transcriptional regulator with GAF, ATPase, and Fis domain
MRSECPDQTRCLHLVASAGKSRVDPTQKWASLGGKFRRFPIGVRKVGAMAVTGEPLARSFEDFAEEHLIVDAAWARREGLRAFAGQPLAHRDRILGVLMVFLFAPAQPDDLKWLKLLGDHAAAALARRDEVEARRRSAAQQAAEIECLRIAADAAVPEGVLVGTSPAARNLNRQIDWVAASGAHALIAGEPGAGQEYAAREVHRRSPRRDRPGLAAHCRSLPAESLEQAFFGERGRLEAARGGTLFLFDVDALPAAFQERLAKVLREGESPPSRLDTRLLATTTVDLKDAVETGAFNRELYYQLTAASLELAPLRHRREDIPLLAAVFLDYYRTALNRPQLRLTQAHSRDLQAYDWPGNVRELQCVIERAVRVSIRPPLRVEVGAGPDRPAAAGPEDESIVEITPEREMVRREKENLLRALRQTEWRIYGAGGAAELLGLKPTTLISRLKKFGLKRPAPGRPE